MATDQKRGNLGIRKIFFTVEVLRLWNRLTTETVDAPCVGMFKALSNLVSWNVSLPMAQ